MADGILERLLPRRRELTPEQQAQALEAMRRAGIMTELPVTGSQAAYFGAQLAPGAGALDAGGYMPSMPSREQGLLDTAVQGQFNPSIRQNIREGNYGTAILQGLGLLGDAAYGIPLAGPVVAGALKAPRAVQATVRAARAASDLPPLENARLTQLGSSTAMQRAVEQGYVGPYYHATMSADKIDEFRPKYNDGLTFMSPTPEFANNWIGKGGSKSQAYEEPLFSLMKADKQAVFDRYVGQYGDNVDKWPSDVKDAYFRDSHSVTEQYEKSGASIMPLMVRAENTFDPAAKTDVLDDLIRHKGYDPDASNIITGISNRDAFASGNYIVLEDADTVDFLRSRGYDSMLVGEGTGRPTNLAVFYPKRIRSEFAAFDPDKKDSRNIMAGYGTVGLGLLGAGATRNAKEKQRNVI